jgi:hypothetical protein
MSLYASAASPERIADARLLAEIETVAESIIVGPQRLMSYRPPNNPRSDVRSNRRLQLIVGKIFTQLVVHRKCNV